MKAVILAAGMGLRLGNITKRIPKAFIPINGEPLIERSLNNLKKVGIKEVIIVVGYLEDLFKQKLGENYNGIKISYITNKNYKSTNSMYSLSRIKNIINDDILLLESDLLYDYRALKDLINQPYKDVLLVSTLTGADDAVFICVDDNSYLKDLGKKISSKGQVIGELVGISKLSWEFLEHLFVSAEEDYAKNEMNYHYEECILKTSKTHPVKCHIMKELIWIEIDTESDLRKAREMIFPKINELSISNKEKKSWNLLWDKKGKDTKNFDPVSLIGYDKAITIPQEDFVKQLLKTIRTKLKISTADELLEVGCGAGMLLIPLSESVKKATGIDISTSLINKLRMAHPELAVFSSEATTIPFENERYNKVLVHSVFQYFSSTKYARDVMTELFRVCKKRGLIFIMDIPDLQKKNDCIKYLSELHPEKYSDKRLQHLFYSKKFFEEMCNKQNLKYEIFDQDIIGYENSRFRFNVLITK